MRACRHEESACIASFCREPDQYFQIHTLYIDHPDLGEIENSLTANPTKTIFNRMVKYSDAELDRTFSALSDPTRRSILARLAEGEAQVNELAEPFGMSLPAVSKHLKVLERANLIIRQKDGRIHRFTVNPKPIASAKSWIEVYQCFWEQQLDSLASYLETTTGKEKAHVPRRKPRK